MWLLRQIPRLALLTTGLVASQPACVNAAARTLTPAFRPASKTAAARPQMIDIALGDDHTLTGRFIDSTGTPIDGAVVTLRQGERAVASSTTLADGSFQISGVPTGAYRLTCGSAAGQVRCWSPDAAPPNAVTDGVTFQDNVVRGQAALVAPALVSTSMVTTAAVSGTAIGGAAAYAAANGNSSSHPRTSSESLVPQGRPALTVEQAQGELVGRDADGNLIRIRGDAPGTRGTATSRSFPPIRRRSSCPTTSDPIRSTLSKCPSAPERLTQSTRSLRDSRTSG